MGEEKNSSFLLFLRIVSCRRMVSNDAVWRQFLLERKDLQFLKAMVQSLTPVGGSWFLPWGRKNSLTHVLTHNRISHSGQVRIFQNTMATKLQNFWKSQNFLKCFLGAGFWTQPAWGNDSCPLNGILNDLWVIFLKFNPSRRASFDSATRGLICLLRFVSYCLAVRYVPV